MSQQNLVQLAKQGDTNAIAALMNRHLQLKGITAKVTSKNNCLQIVLQSQKSIDQESITRYIHNGIARLDLKTAATLQIQSKRVGAETLDWTKRINLSRHDSDSIIAELNQANNFSQENKFQEDKPCREKVSSEHTIKLQDNQAVVESFKQASAKQPINNAAINKNSPNFSHSLLAFLSNNNQRNNRNLVPVLAIGTIFILLTLVLVRLVDAKNQIKEANDSLRREVDTFASQYYYQKLPPKKGIDSLSTLAQEYTPPFLSDYPCGDYSEKTLEEERKKEITAQQAWELAFVTNQEKIQLFQESHFDESPRFREFMKAASERIVREKECAKKQTVAFPLQEIDPSHEKYLHIVQADENQELGYIGFVDFQKFGANSSSYAAISESYIRIKINNVANTLKGTKKEIHSDLKEGYEICLYIRNTMLGKNLLVGDATRDILENDKVRGLTSGVPFIGAETIDKKLERITMAVSKLCPQLNK